MKYFLTSGIYLFLTLSATLMIQHAEANVEQAIKFAEEKILVLELHMEHCEEEGYNNGLIMDYQYHNGYVHGARDAYNNMLRKIDQN
jgi:hypothetical protein